MRRSFICACLVVAALALGARPQSAAACSILPTPTDQQARALQDTIDRADLIVRGKVAGTRPVAVAGRYYQQLTIDVARSWRGAPVAQVTVVGSLLTYDTGIASTIGAFTGTASPPACGRSPRAIGDDLVVFAQGDGAGHSGLATIATSPDALATTLQAQLGVGSAPPPASPPFPVPLPLLLVAVVGVAFLDARRRYPHWFRRG